MTLPQFHIGSPEEDDGSGRVIIGQIHARSLRIDALKKVGTPEVAIFWVTKMLEKFDFLYVSTPWPEAEQVGDIWVERSTHQKLWDSYNYKNILKLEGAWTDWPRGRVAYKRTGGLFTVFADPQLLTPYYQSQILQQFNLPLSNTQFLEDPHYDAKLQIPPTLDPAKEDPTA